jgi:hypothetical protein
MSSIKESVVSLVEKTLDPTLNLETLTILGLTMPNGISEIGALGLTIAACNTVQSIRTYQFEEAFRKFTIEIEVLTIDEKLAFFQKYSKKSVRELGEQAIILLDKIEMPLAASMIGKAHYLLALDEIDVDDYYNFCHVIRNLNKYMFTQLVDVYQNPKEKRHQGGVYALFANYGLMFKLVQPLYPSDNTLLENIPDFDEYALSNFGYVFCEKIIKPFI